MNFGAHLTDPRGDQRLHESLAEGVAGPGEIVRRIATAGIGDEVQPSRTRRVRG